jgi:hypothetical protein
MKRNTTQMNMQGVTNVEPLDDVAADDVTLAARLVCDRLVRLDVAVESQALHSHTHTRACPSMAGSDRGQASRPWFSGATESLPASWRRQRWQCRDVRRVVRYGEGAGDVLRASREARGGSGWRDDGCFCRVGVCPPRPPGHETALAGLR